MKTAKHDVAAENQAALIELKPLPVANPLTPEEKRELTRCEETISAHFEGFRKTGEALLEIRDSRLYRETHQTFEAYCRARWEFSKTQANRLISASSVVGALEEAGAQPALVTRLSESAIRPLTVLKPAEQKKVFKTLVREVQPVGGQVPARVITDVVRKVVPGAARKKKSLRRKPSDLIRRSAVLEAISEWEKEESHNGLSKMKPRDIIQAIRVLVEEL